MTTPSPEQIRDLIAKAEAATPGPWGVQECGYSVHHENRGNLELRAGFALSVEIADLGVDGWLVEIEIRAARMP